MSLFCNLQGFLYALQALYVILAGWAVSDLMGRRRSYMMTGPLVAMVVVWVVGLALIFLQSWLIPC